MRVQLIHNEDPTPSRVSLHRLLQMRHEVDFRARWPQRWTYHPPCCYFKVGDQAECAMTDVLELAVFNAPWLHSWCGRCSLQRLNAGHFIRTHQMHTLL